MRRFFQARDARQGRRGFPVFVILLVSLALVCAVWFAVEIYGTSIQSPRTEATQPTTGEPAPSQSGG
ncbi:MAG: hypothetical protein M9939_12025 [Mesorhizobium sp.]|nr:hypothetical protein [Mesorhizobium sp.]MCO5161860.1 hypothetical protein [Mesorhizobium sp.]